MMKYAKIPKHLIEWLVFGLLSLLWLPMPFIGFDPHHDGLILGTIRLLYDSLKSHGPWPFNQYGPAWVLPFEWFSNLFSKDSLLLSIRFFTIICYFFAAGITYLLAKKFMIKRNAIFVIIILFASQPFLSNFNSDLIPWPSAFAMPLIPLTAYFLLEGSSGDVVRGKYAFAAGLTSVAILFTRGQIGIILILTLLVINFTFSMKRTLILYTLGLLTGTSLFFLLLIKFGWLKQSLYDEFIFGSTYITGDTSTYPKPVWTLSLTLIFLIVFLLLKLFCHKVSHSSSMSKRIYSLLSFLSLCIMVLAFITLSKRGLNIFELEAVISRRFWISFLLSVVIFSVFEVLFKFIFQPKKFIVDDGNYRLVILVAVASVAELQIWPLFDQMHSWWGSTPGIVLIPLAISSILSKSPLMLAKLRKARLPILIAFLVFSLTISAGSIGISRMEFKTSGLNHIYGSMDQVTSEQRLQTFFSKNLEPSDRIVNLCINANVFFKFNHPTPASRAFVYWSPMVSSIELITTLTNSRPNKIVTCTLNTTPSLATVVNRNFENTFRGIGVKRLLLSKLKNVNGGDWAVYRVIYN